MGLIVTVTFALCLWVVLTAIGGKSFDGLFLALIIIAAGVGLKITAGRIRSTARED
jgi:hypothetical protein